MPKLTITTNSGEVVAQIDLGEYNLQRPLGCAGLLDEIVQADKAARQIESKDIEDAVALRRRKRAEEVCGND